MPRVKRSVPSRRRHKKILNLAKGFRMTHRTLFRPANEALLHALEYAYRDRRARKRDMRKLWIARINAASRSQGMPYNQFMHGLKVAGVSINRKMLADGGPERPRQPTGRPAGGSRRSSELIEVRDRGSAGGARPRAPGDAARSVGRSRVG